MFGDQPCRGFTPVLTASSKGWADQGVRVVFVSSGMMPCTVSIAIESVYCMMMNDVSRHGLCAVLKLVF